MRSLDIFCLFQPLRSSSTFQSSSNSPQRPTSQKKSKSSRGQITINKLNIFANFFLSLKYSDIKINNLSISATISLFLRKFFSRAHLPYVAPTKYRQSSDYAAIVLGTSLLFTGLYLFCKFVLFNLYICIYK